LGNVPLDEPERHPIHHARLKDGVAYETKHGVDVLVGADRSRHLHQPPLLVNDALALFQKTRLLDCGRRQIGKRQKVLHLLRRDRPLRQKVIDADIADDLTVGPER